MVDPDKLRKCAALGNNVHAPWPQKELKEAADEIERLQSENTTLKMHNEAEKIVAKKNKRMTH